MDNKRIARILYNMSLDMDYEDYTEHAELEIDTIADEIQFLKDSKCDSLVQALEMIAAQNEGMEFWKEGIKNEKKL